MRARANRLVRALMSALGFELALAPAARYEALFQARFARLRWRCPPRLSRIAFLECASDCADKTLTRRNAFSFFNHLEGKL
jgi:hypothetical protein